MGAVVKWRRRFRQLTLLLSIYSFGNDCMKGRSEGGRGKKEGSEADGLYRRVDRWFVDIDDIVIVEVEVEVEG